MNYVDVEILPQGNPTISINPTGCTNVGIQPYSILPAPHANNHYISGNDPINHNNLSGLQGGKTGEYFHLTQEQLSSVVNSNSGISSFYTDIPSGVQEMSVSFPKTFSNIPVVISNILSPYNYTFLTSISSVTTTGFNILFSRQINNTGFQLINLAYTV